MTAVGRTLIPDCSFLCNGNGYSVDLDQKPPYFLVDVNVDVHVDVRVDVHVDVHVQMSLSRSCFEALAPAMIEPP